ncbi:MAG TPA: hypothetical protein VHX38_10175 [Pseudonocardiaceae bacterium]|jgi:hypothetical protein|nr:hypothetical protein [Pseudonocardiaceae bacterium]
MPTIEITTSQLSTPRKRAIAVRLTRWLSQRDILSSHVVVRFVQEPQNSLFSAGMPIEAMAMSTEAPCHATVSCHISPDRDHRFRDELAEELLAALDMVDRSEFVYIEFRPTHPDLVYVAPRGRLHRADQIPVPR